jgi:hypothetical protein
VAKDVDVKGDVRNNKNELTARKKTNVVRENAVRKNKASNTSNKHNTKNSHSNRRRRNTANAMSKYKKHRRSGL